MRDLDLLPIAPPWGVNFTETWRGETRRHTHTQNVLIFVLFCPRRGGGLKWGGQESVGNQGPSLFCVCVLFAATPSQNSRREGEEEKEKKEKKKKGKGPNQSPPSPEEMSLAAASSRRTASPRNAKGSLKIYPSVEGSPGILETVEASSPRSTPQSHTLTRARAGGRRRRRRGGGSVCLLVSSFLRFPRLGAGEHAHAPWPAGEQPASTRRPRPGRRLPLRRL